MLYRFGRLAVLLLVALLGVAGLSACEDESAGPEQDTTVEDITEEDNGTGEATAFDVEALAGQQVTVSGEVTNVITAQAFEISGDDVGGEPLLVFSATAQTDLQEGDVVKVTGTVRQVARDTFEDDFGFGFDEDFSEFVEEFAVAASQVQQIQNGGS